MPKFRFFGQREVFENVTIEVEADSEEEAFKILEDEDEYWASNEAVEILWEENEPATDNGFDWELLKGE